MSRVKSYATNTIAEPINTNTIERAKQLVPEYLVMADFNDMEIETIKMPTKYYTIAEATNTQTEKLKWLFINDENLVGLHDLINQVGLLKESIQTKTKELKGLTIAIKIGNKDVNLLN